MEAAPVTTTTTAVEIVAAEPPYEEVTRNARELAWAKREYARNTRTYGNKFSVCMSTLLTTR